MVECSICGNIILDYYDHVVYRVKEGEAPHIKSPICPDCWEHLDCQCGLESLD